MTNSDLTIITTCGESFSNEASCDLAFSVFRRFGRNIYPALCAWQRLLENNCEVSQFARLVRESKFYDALAADSESVAQLNDGLPASICSIL